MTTWMAKLGVVDMAQLASLLRHTSHTQAQWYNFNTVSGSDVQTATKVINFVFVNRFRCEEKELYFRKIKISCTLSLFNENVVLK